MLFSFDKLLINCIHDDLLTNRLQENRLRNFFPSLIRVLARHSAHTWKQIKAEDSHLHILSDKEKDFLEKQRIKKAQKNNKSVGNKPPSLSLSTKLLIGGGVIILIVFVFLISRVKKRKK